MERLKLEDFYGYTYLSQLLFSPDGARAVITAKRADEADNSYKSDLWLYTVEDGSFRRLTSAGDVGLSLWLDDGTVLFTACRDKALRERVEAGETWTVFYRLSLGGGEAGEYFRLPRAVAAARLLDGERLILSCGVQLGRPDIEAMAGEEKAAALAKQKADRDYELLDELPFCLNGAGFTSGRRQELRIYNVPDGSDAAVCAAPMSAELADAGDGRLLYISSEYINGLNSMRNGLWLWDAATGEKSELVPCGKWTIYGAYFMDGRVCAAMTDGAEYGINESPRLYHVDGAQPQPFSRPITFGSSTCTDCTLGESDDRHVKDGALYYVATEGCSSSIFRVDGRGSIEKLPMAGGSVDGFAFGAGGIYFIGMRGLGLQELYRLDGGGEKKLSDFNGGVLKDKLLSVPRRITFENGGVELDGFVMEPVGCRPGKKYPALLDVHGGPRTVYGDIFFHEMQLWASEGYFVFFCNPRGSDGRGDAFADIRGRYGREDYSDIMRFTDLVLAEYPDIDPLRLGVTGGSYGGFMTNWIIGNTHRFAAAASQRSISNWVSMSHTSDISYFFSEDQVAATPWDGLETMWEQSPLKYAPNVKTPTLFIHSAEDYRCPLSEGLQMFSALKRFGVEARLCMFRGENHELSRSGKPLHRRRRLQEITDWFNAHLN